jgi:N-acetylated-alpha-linked acidic dipeptidase
VVYIDQYPGGNVTVFLSLFKNRYLTETDPTTPGYPSKPGVPRVESPSVLPKIPSIPISQRDALPLLRALDGNGSGPLRRDGWTGGLKANYSTGPAPNITLSISNKMKDVTTPIWNVIGIINGTNPDETIIVGNHRDAWIIGGAADPNSGSAMLVEVTKAFGKLLKTGWKPKRNM